MNVSAIGSPSASALAALYARQGTPDLSSPTATGKSGSSNPNNPADIKKAATQFEAIMLRQLLGPSIEPMMSGGLGGSGEAGSGVYAYMLTDVLADSLSKGGGLGLSKMLEKQLTPRGSQSDVLSNTDSKPKPFSSPLT